MKSSNFSPDQFVDAASLNEATANASGATALNMAVTLYPGLMYPDQAAVTVSGLTANVNLPAPFGVLFATGAFSQAHGVIDGADTPAYAVGFSGLVPGSGAAVTAYLLAAYHLLGQDPQAITGPPPGHPDFNPNFQPYTSYRTQVDSLALSASLTPPDNTTTFELARFSLASGAVALPAPDTHSQIRFSGLRHIQTITTAASGAVLSPSGKQFLFTAPDLRTLPSLAFSNGRTFILTSASAGFTVIQAASGDFIYGSLPTPAYPAQAILLINGQSCQLAASNGRWQVIAGSPWRSMYRQLLTANLDVFVANGGDDVTNNGLSSGSPLASLNAAFNLIGGNFDPGVWVPRINLASGHYAGGNLLRGLLPTGYIEVVGAGSGVTFLDGASGIGLQVHSGGVYLHNVSISATGAGIGQGIGIAVYNMVGGVAWNNVEFLACSQAHVQLHAGAEGMIAGPVTISGDAPVHIHGSTGANLIHGNTPIITLNGARNFNTAFIVSESGASLRIPSNDVSFAGNVSGVTGPRYSVNSAGGIDTLGGGDSFFPGSLSGINNGGWIR